MNVIETAIPDIRILEPRVFGDQRGWFMETWSLRDMEALGLHFQFVQDNHSYSASRGTLRGIHFQRGEAAQAKLVRCVRGAVLDVAVDLRRGSPTYKRWVSAELSAENKRMLLIPRGFGHAFLTLTDGVEFVYRADNYYAPGMEGGIRWDDPDLGVEWGEAAPLLSEKDRGAPSFQEVEPLLSEWEGLACTTAR